jgi:hypothetical protein
MNREELRRFGERILAGSVTIKWPEGTKEVHFTWGWNEERTYRKLISVEFFPARRMPGVVYDDYGQPDPEATALQNKKLEMRRALEAINIGSRKGGRQARTTRRDSSVRKDEALLNSVRAYRAKNPNAGNTAIAKALLAKRLDQADPKTRKQAIDALRARIRRLETRESGAASSSRRSLAKYEPPNRPDGKPWWWKDTMIDKDGNEAPNLSPPSPFKMEIERQQLEMEYKFARIREGGAQGRLKAGEQKRERAARDREALLAAVKAHRMKYPDHGRPAIAEALFSTHGREVDHADPQDRERAIRALTKKIERLEKALDA